MFVIFNLADNNKDNIFLKLFYLYACLRDLKKILLLSLKPIS